MKAQVLTTVCRAPYDLAASYLPTSFPVSHCLIHSWPAMLTFLFFGHTKLVPPQGFGCDILFARGTLQLTEWLACIILQVTSPERYFLIPPSNIHAHHPITF